jgi:hypothetical protein
LKNKNGSPATAPLRMRLSGIQGIPWNLGRLSHNYVSAMLAAQESVKQHDFDSAPEKKNAWRMNS